MSVAATPDGHVLYGSGKESGVYRFPPASLAADRAPLLLKPGGVAADTASLKWAATQGPNEIVVFAGEELTKTVRLPPDATLYADGLLSFGPQSSVVVAAQSAGGAPGEVWFYRYQTRGDGFSKLFSWTVERLADFVVGPRMPWPKDIPPSLRSKY